MSKQIGRKQVWIGFRKLATLMGEGYVLRRLDHESKIRIDSCSIFIIVECWYPVKPGVDLYHAIFL
jgi:hypothetical protein